MKTLAFNATFGTVAGYNHSNEGFMDVEDFVEIWNHHMMDIHLKTGILVGCVCFNSKTVYPVAFGCPKGGEDTITVTGHYNPKFFSDTMTLEDHKKQTIELCKRVRTALKQTTVSLTFTEVADFVYITD